MKTLQSFFICIFLVFSSARAVAAELPFDQKTFDDLRAAGKPVVVHVYAQWCGTCKKQTSIITPMLSDPEFKALTLLKADYDQEKTLLKTLNVSLQSTFIVFKGEHEVGRSTAVTEKDKIAALFRKAL